MHMSTLALAIVNFVLAAGVIAVMVRLHVWAILTAHHDHVPAVEPARVIVVEPERPEQLPEAAVLAL
jgi:hypothetical protein